MLDQILMHYALWSIAKDFLCLEQKICWYKKLSEQNISVGRIYYVMQINKIRKHLTECYLSAGKDTVIK
jgi:hypothetical protein